MDTETPADKAVRLLGVKPIAYACDLSTDAVRKWRTQGKGLIPARYQRTVLTLAIQQGVPLNIEDVVGGG